MVELDHLKYISAMLINFRVNERELSKGRAISCPDRDYSEWVEAVVCVGNWWQFCGSEMQYTRTHTNSLT